VCSLPRRGLRAARGGAPLALMAFMTATRFLRLAAVAVLALLAPGVRAELRDEGRAFEPSCALLVPGSEDATVADCRRCHAGSGSGHPVGLDYGHASGGRGGGIPLRTGAEAVRRGAFLPGGELRCTTCHARSSPWRYRLALPPGADVRPAVNPRDPSTYDPAAARATSASHGSQVGTKPLCLLCHAID
jgi:hypothetical protein